MPEKVDSDQTYLLEQGYTAEDIEQAQERLATMTVEDLLGIDEYISKLEQNMPEAPASLNFFGVSEEGWNLQYTLRDVDEMVLMARYQRFVDYLNSIGISPKQVGQGATKSGATATSKDSVYVPEGVDATDDSVDVYEVENLVHQVSQNGTHFLIAKGGKYSQYGYKAWPEVVEKAGVNVEEMPFGETTKIPPELRLAWVDKNKKKIVAFGGKTD